MEYELWKKVVEIKAMVTSESKEGAYYIVECQDHCWSCTCPQFQKRKKVCKHIDCVRDNE